MVQLLRHTRLPVKWLKTINQTLVVNSSMQRNYSNRAYFHRPESMQLTYKNIGERILESSQKYAKRKVIVALEEQRSVTYEEARQEAEILAVKLKQLGLQRGDHIAIWAPNTIQWYISFLAAALAGFPLVCLSPALQQLDMAYALEKAKVKVLITMQRYGKQDFHGVLKNLLPDVTDKTKEIRSSRFPHLRAILMKSERAVSEFLNYDEIMQQPTNSADISKLINDVSSISPESIFNIQFTSGTTGKPKAAQLTHFNFINSGAMHAHMLNVTEGEKCHCSILPWFHVFGTISMFINLQFGYTHVIPAAIYDSAKTLQALSTMNCGSIFGTPTLFVDLVQLQRKMQLPLSPIQLGFVGGASVTSEMYRQSKEVLGIRDLRIGYGMTEGSGAVFLQSGKEGIEEQVRTVGTLFGNGEAKVINENGDTVRLGEPGELCVKGWFTMAKYFEDEEKTNEVLTRDGWLKTGDIFILESNGVGCIVGRKKEMIIRGGENIFPKEIEDYLDTHPNVAESHVIGVPDDRLGEEICAFLRLKPNAEQLTAGDIRSFCDGKIAHFKVPRYVRIVDQLPKTASNKIQKFKLKETFLKAEN